METIIRTLSMIITTHCGELMAAVKIEQVKRWLLDPEFNAKLLPENRELAYKISTTCNCNWASFLSKLISTQPELLEEWANK
jgi:hypothetical protein